MARSYGANTEKGKEVREQIRVEKERGKNRAKKLNLCISGGIVLVGAIVIALTFITVSNRNADTSDKLTQIQEKEATYSQMQEASQDAEVEYVDPTVDNVSVVGRIVCNLQNQLSQYTYEENKSNADALSKEHLATLDEFRGYFTDGSLADSTNGTWMSDILTPGLLANVTGDDCPYEWEFNENFDYLRGDNLLSVAWLCYDTADTDHEKLIMTVTASYDAAAQTFSDVTLYETAWTAAILNDDSSEPYYSTYDESKAETLDESEAIFDETETE